MRLYVGFFKGYDIHSELIDPDIVYELWEAEGYDDGLLKRML